MAKPLSFRVGDRVFVKVSPAKTWKSHFETGFDAYVVEVSRDRGRFSYGVGNKRRGCIWWYDHEDLTLLKPATEATELKAYRLRNDD